MPSILVKRGTEAALIAANPVVASGELIYSIDTSKLKIGDGVTSYSGLPVAGSGTFLQLSGGTLTGSLTGTSANFSSSLQVNSINVSVSGHTHTASNITDFNSSVSGLLPVTNIVAGTNITTSNSSGSRTISVSSSLTDTIFHPFLLGGM